MGKLVNIENARQAKEYKRKDAKVKKLQASFRLARETTSTQLISKEKLKKMFKRPPKKKI